MTATTSPDRTPGLLRRALPAAALAGAVLLAGCAPATVPTSVAPGPPDDASPEDVVRAYVADVNAHDLAAARALFTARMAAEERRYPDGLDDVVAMDDLVVRPSTTVGVAQDAPAPGLLSTYVPVEFVLRQHHVESMPDGPTTWGYTLVRTGPTAPWRIDSQGVG